MIEEVSGRFWFTLSVVFVVLYTLFLIEGPGFLKWALLPLFLLAGVYIVIYPVGNPDMTAGELAATGFVSAFLILSGVNMLMEIEALRWLTILLASLALVSLSWEWSREFGEEAGKE